MKKTLIAAAVAAAVAAPAANAGVVIYGKMHASIDYLDENASGMVGPTGLAVSGWQVQSRASRIGFKGSEDLGNGLKAIWKVEFGVDITDNGGWNSNRNRYIGLAGDWGTFLIGRHDTPYKMAFYSTGIDMMGDTIADANAMYGFDERRASNAIAYVSPNMNGLTVAAAIVPGEGMGVGATPFGTPFTGPLAAFAPPLSAGNGMADAYSIGLMYKNNGLKLAIGYEDLGFGVTAPTVPLTTHDDTKWFLGAGYSMNAFDVSIGYEDRSAALKGGVALGADQKTWAISAAYTFGNNKVIATFGNTDTDFTAGGVLLGNTDADSWALGLEHKFSKRTKAYAIYASSERQLGGTNGVPVPGITTPAGSIPSQSGKGFSLGMIHNF
jgi:predicted porin